MPAAPRSSKKAQKIIDEVIGIPPNRINVASKKTRQRRNKVQSQQNTLSR